MKRKAPRGKQPVKKAAAAKKKVQPIPAGYHAVTVVMLSDEYAGMDFMGPQTRGGTTVHIH